MRGLPVWQEQYSANAAYPASHFVVPPEVKSFDEYTAGIENFMSLNISRIEELRGNLLSVFTPSFMSVLTNSYYGGKIAITFKKSEFTATEERIIELVSDGLNETLQVAWRDLMPINITHQNREINPQFASFVDGAELVIIALLLSNFLIPMQLASTLFIHCRHLNQSQLNCVHGCKPTWLRMIIPGESGWKEQFKHTVERHRAT